LTNSTPQRHAPLAQSLQEEEFFAGRGGTRTRAATPKCLESNWAVVPTLLKTSYWSFQAPATRET
jgi:hypothetical protein